MKNQENTLEIPNGIGNFNFSDLFSEEPTTEESENEDIIFNVEGDNNQEEEEQEQEEQATDPKKDRNTPPTKEKEGTEKTVELENTQPSVYAGLAKKYIEMGSWQDAKIEIDGEEVILSELDNIDEETFLQIQQSQEASRNEDLRDKYINKEELDDISLQILEISKNKGDLTKILNAKKNYIDPLEKFDLTQESHQEALVRQKYMIESNGKLSQKDLDTIIKNRKEDLSLDKEAEEYAEALKKGFDDFLKSENDKALKAQEDFKETVKSTRKQVKEHLSKYGLKDTAIKPMLDFISADKGNDPIMQAVEELKKDPEALSDFLFYLNNKEEYLKAIGEKATKGKDVNVLRTLNLIPKKQETKAGKQQPKEEKDPLVLRYIN